MTGAHWVPGGRGRRFRNRALLRLLYAGGLRVSEACALRWRDLQTRDDAGQVTVYGKGGTTRVVLLSEATWRVLLARPGAAAVAGGGAGGADGGGDALPGGELARAWARRGYELGLGVGVAQGYATPGRVGSEGRSDYAAVGPVTNLASRLCWRRQRPRSC